LSNIQQAFAYQSSNDLQDDSFEGRYDTYPGGGYCASLGTSLESAQPMTRDLERTRWIDMYTRAVFTEFNVFNADSGLASLVIVLLELPTDGDVSWIWRAEVIQLYRYTG
jgi:polycystin 1L2